MSRAAHLLAHARAVALLALTLAAPAASAAGAAPPPSTTLTFEVNRGQAPPAARFLARGPGHTLLLEDTAAVVSLPARDADTSEPADTLRLRPLGARVVAPVPSHPHRARSHYYRGADPAGWVTDVPHFERVRYPDLYPGIDLVFYGREGRFEYDFVVAPGADPARIRLDITGAAAPFTAPSGDLVFPLAHGDVAMLAPVLYQDLDDGARRPIDGGYVLNADDTLGFRVGPYDPTRSLVIDPVVAFSTYLGGAARDTGVAIATAPDGSSVTVGYTASDSFLGDTTAGVADAFVTKLAADGALAWSVRLGGTRSDLARGVAIDPLGNVYLTGETESSNFPSTPGAFQTVLRGTSDAFVTKLTPDGALAWSTFLGGDPMLLPSGPVSQCTGYDAGRGIAVDPTGSAYVTGETRAQHYAQTAYVLENQGFPTTASAYQPTHAGKHCDSVDAFFTKLTPDGSALMYSTFLGGPGVSIDANTGVDGGYAIAIDSAGFAYITGITTGEPCVTGDGPADCFATTPGVVQPTFGGSTSDAFVVKFDPTASGPASLVWSTYLGGGNSDLGLGIAVAPSGAVAVVGGTSSSTASGGAPAFPTTQGALQRNLFASIDGFVAVLSPDATSFVYSTYLGGAGYDVARAVAIDALGDVYVTGETQNAAYASQTPHWTASPAGGCGASGGVDAYVTKLSPSGSMVYSTYLGGTANDYGYGIAVSPDGAAVVTGMTSGAFPTTLGAYQPASAGAGDAFVIRLAPWGCGAPGVPTTLTFTAQPVDTVAGEPMPAAVVVHVADASGYPVAGAGVTLVALDADGLAIDELATVVADDAGDATFDALLLHLAGATTLTATAASAEADSAPFDVAPGAPTGPITLAAAPEVLPADGASRAEISSAPLTDAFGNVALDAAITVSTTLGAVAPGAAGDTDADPDTAGLQVLTAADGTLRFWVLAPTTVGAAQVTAAAVLGDAAGTTALVFVPGAPSGLVALTASPSPLVANGTDTATVTGGPVTDAFANVVPAGTLVTVATSLGDLAPLDAAPALPGVQVATDAAGAFAFALTATEAGAATLTATSVAGDAFGTATLLLLGGPAAGAVALTATPAVQPAIGAVDVHVTSAPVTDAFGNLVPAGTLFTVTASLGAFADPDLDPATPGVQVATAADGTLSATLTALTAPGVTTLTVAATLGNAHGATTAKFYAAPADAGPGVHTVCLPDSPDGPCEFDSPGRCAVGDDDNDGLGDATRVADGDTCLVLGGRYHESVGVQAAPLPAISRHSLTFACAAGTTCTLDGGNAHGWGFSSYGGAIATNRGWTITGFELLNFAEAAVTGNGGRITVRDCRLHDIIGRGITDLGSGSLIERNVVENTGEEGIICAIDGAVDVIIRNNLVVHAGASDARVGIACEQQDALIAHNTVDLRDRTFPWTAGVRYGIAGTHVRYNVVVGGDLASLVARAPGNPWMPGSSVGNLVLGWSTANGTPYLYRLNARGEPLYGYLNPGGPNGPGPGDAWVDLATTAFDLDGALFIGPEDHHLAPGALARDAAAGSTEALDLDGAPRDASPDRGAYEYDAAYVAAAPVWPVRELIAHAPNDASPAMAKVPDQGPVAAYLLAADAGATDLTFAMRRSDGSWFAEAIARDVAIPASAATAPNLRTIAVAVHPITGRPAVLYVADVAGARELRFAERIGHDCGAGCDNPSWSGCDAAVVATFAPSDVVNVRLDYDPDTFEPVAAYLVAVAGACGPDRARFDVRVHARVEGAWPPSGALVDTQVCGQAFGRGFDFALDPATGLADLAWATRPDTTDRTRLGGVRVARQRPDGTFAVADLALGGAVTSSPLSGTWVDLAHRDNGDLGLVTQMRFDDTGAIGLGYLARVGDTWTTPADYVDYTSWGGSPDLDGELQGLALAFDPAGVPHIAYSIAGVTALATRLAAPDMHGDADWDKTLIDAQRATGFWPDLVITDAGALWVSAQNATDAPNNRDVKLLATADPGGLAPGYVAPVACDDHDACTVEGCDARLGCLSAPAACDDHDACTVDGCDPASGCVNAPIDGDGDGAPVCGTDGRPGTADDDCDDADAANSPGHAETCDAQDNDCDGQVDEGYAPDSACFLPGACAAHNAASSCVAGIETDCRTGTPAANDVSCDDVDSDCDGVVDEDCNHAPAAGDDLDAVALEDTATVLDVLANDVDVDGDPLTLVGVVQPTAGAVVVHPDGLGLTYVPAPDFHGVDAFEYAVSDGRGAEGRALVLVTVLPVNDAPIAFDDAAITDEDTAVRIDALVNDADVDGDALVVSGLVPADHGRVDVAADGALVYTPDADFHGDDAFAYAVTDAAGAVAFAAVVVRVLPVNDAPVATADTATTDEDTAVRVEVLANDADVDGDALVVFLEAPAAHGALAVAPDGAVLYTPEADFNGQDAFAYVVDDGAGGVTSTTVVIAVTAVNDAPIAADDVAAVDEDASVHLDVLANDVDVDGDVLVVSAVTTPGHGQVVLGADGALTYTPVPDFNGLDAFTYTLDDGAGGAAVATVAVTVRAVNDAPGVIDDTVATAEDMPVAVAVLANDTDLDSGALTVFAWDGLNGTTTLAADGVVTYAPDADFHGVDSFAYSVDDGAGGTAVGTVTVTVLPVNDAPVAVDDLANTDQGVAVTVDVLSNDTDVDLDALVVTVGAAAHGATTANADGSITYAPAASFWGQDAFSYAITDPAGATASGTVTVTVAPNAPPVVASPGALSAFEDEVVSLTLQASDPEGGHLSFTAGGTLPPGLEVDGDSGVVSGSPDAGSAGVYAVTITVSDGASSASVSFTWTIVARPVGDDCTRGIGYWKRHSAAWPVTTLTLGGVSYGANALRAMLAAAPHGDASVILARQLIGAELNVRAGANADAIADALDAAHAWLAAHGYGSRPHCDDRERAIALARAIAAYNEGLRGPGACGGGPTGGGDDGHGDDDDHGGDDDDDHGGDDDDHDHHKPKPPHRRGHGSGRN